MAWLESPKKKKRRRYYNSKKSELDKLNAKWTAELQAHGFGAQLDRDSVKGGQRTNGMLLAANEIHDAAYQYADKKAESSLTWYQSLVSGNGGIAIITFIVAVVVAVVSVICPPVAVFGYVIFGGMSAAAATAAIVGAAAARCFIAYCKRLFVQVNDKPKKRE